MFCVYNLLTCCVFSLLFLSSDFLHYGPRPRDSESRLGSRSATPKSTLNRINTIDGIPTPDNCSVCKQISTPVDTLVAPIRQAPNGREVESKHSVGSSSCMQQLDHGRCLSNLYEHLSSVCPCMTPPRKDMHELDIIDTPNNTNIDTVDEHDGMELETYSCMQHSPVQPHTPHKQVVQGHRTFPEMRSYSEQSEDTTSSIVSSAYKPPNFGHSRNQSDSAISMSIINGSASAGTNSLVSSPAKVDNRNMFRRDDSTASEPEGFPEDIEIKPLDELVPPHLVKSGEFDVMMQDFTKKINSLSRSESVKQAYTKFRQSSEPLKPDGILLVDYDSDSSENVEEDDPFLPHSDKKSVHETSLNAENSPLLEGNLRPETEEESRTNSLPPNNGASNLVPGEPSRPKLVRQLKIVDPHMDKTDSGVNCDDNSSGCDISSESRNQDVETPRSKRKGRKFQNLIKKSDTSLQGSKSPLSSPKSHHLSQSCSVDVASTTESDQNANLNDTAVGSIDNSKNKSSTMPLKWNETVL